MAESDRDHRRGRVDRRDRAQVVPLDRRDRSRARRRSGSRSASCPRTTRSGSAAKPATRPRCSCPGLRFKIWPMFGVKKFPWVQVPAGEIGVVIAQVGAPLPIGAKSAVYKPEFGNFSSLREFVDDGGQKGVQRPVLPPGTLVPIHPVAFLVVTTQGVYGLPVSPELASQSKGGLLAPESFGLTPDQLRVVVIAPDGVVDLIGVVTTLEGPPLPSGDIASRLGGFDDIAAMEAARRRRAGRRPHRGAARQQERPAQQLSGLPGVPRRRRQDRAAARPAAVRRVPAEPVPRARRPRADAGGEPGRGRGDQGLRRPAHARHVGRGVQVRVDRAARPPRHLGGAAAHRQVPDQPARVRRRDRAHVHPHAELGRRDVGGARPRRAAVVDRGQEP